MTLVKITPFDDYYSAAEFTDPNLEKMEYVSDKLNYLFTALNGMTEGFEMPPVPSMSAGDVIEFDNLKFWCAPCGWAEIKNEDALKKYLETENRDRTLFAPFFDSEKNLLEKRSDLVPVGKFKN